MYLLPQTKTIKQKNRKLHQCGFRIKHKTMALCTRVSLWTWLIKWLLMSSSDASYTYMELPLAVIVEFSLDFSIKSSASHLGRQATVVAWAWQWREAETWLVPGESVGRLEERWSMPEGAEPSLLGEQLLVGHWVDGVRERKGRAVRSETESGLVFGVFLS